MKLLLTIAVIIFGAFSLNSQEIVIIEDMVFGGDPIQFKDTVLTSIRENGDCNGWPGEYYFIDFDQDSLIDISVKLYCYFGGNGDDAKIEFQSYGMHRTIVDTNFSTTLQDWDFVNDTVATWVDNVTIVKPYYIGDTLTIEQESRLEPTNISTFVTGWDPVVYYINIDDFIGDTIYIAFLKEEDSYQSFYYIKAFLESHFYLHLISAWSNDMLFGITDVDSPQYKVLSVNYFDILGREIIKPNKGFYIERTTTTKGIICKKYYIP